VYLLVVTHARIRRVLVVSVNRSGFNSLVDEVVEDLRRRQAGLQTADADDRHRVTIGQVAGLLGPQFVCTQTVVR
jgi:hypothetical protein